MAVALALALTAAAHADTYDYTGSSMPMTVAGFFPEGTGSITGDFTITGALGDNLNDVAIDPASFSFTAYGAKSGTDYAISNKGSSQKTDHRVR